MTVYLDTSSLIKLYVSEAGSDLVHQLVDAADIVTTSTLAYPEARAALARRRREDAVSASAFAGAKRALDADWPQYLALEATPSLCRTAGDLAERYRLRGYDSVHLASFLEVARGAGPRNVRFSSFDDRLNDAAKRATRTLARA
ncbi:MAG: type II toxin-antitoxin system VapC family toxin [Vicinamibacterales bacterium]